MERPHIADAPGLAWRPRKQGWAAVWLARQDVAQKGFKPSTRQLAVFESQPTEAQADDVRLACARLQREMYDFLEAKPKEFGGTVLALIAAYQTDPDSPYHAARYRTRRDIDNWCRRINAKHGTDKLADLGARDLKRWYEDTRWPEGKQGPERVASAHAMITIVRMMLSFGTAFEVEKAPRDRISECGRLKAILTELTFEKGKGRTETVSIRQSEDIAAAAEADGLASVALAQELMRRLGLRQRDVLGEWVPVSEPGVSTVLHHGQKWLRGIRWEEISASRILTHAMSKSRKGKVLEFDLTDYPEIIEKLDRIPANMRTGPVVVCERTGRPWKGNHFRLVWREMADKAGVPKGVQNRDNRAGLVTEVIAATNGNIEAARKMAGHSDGRTTAGYSRDQLATNRKTAAIVTAFRTKNEA